MNNSQRYGRGQFFFNNSADQYYQGNRGNQRSRGRRENRGGGRGGPQRNVPYPTQHRAPQPEPAVEIYIKDEEMDRMFRNVGGLWQIMDIELLKKQIKKYENLESVQSEQEKEEKKEESMKKMPPPKTIIAVDGTTTYTLFHTKKYVFSNHFPANFTVNSINYSSSEQYYMRTKAMTFGDDETAAKILSSSNPTEMKKLGQKIAGFDEEQWKPKAIKIMKTGCFNKFSQNKALRLELFKTHGTTLVEANPLDSFWGIGLLMEEPEVRDSSKWNGENQLGIILTEIREELGKEEAFKAEYADVKSS